MENTIASYRRRLGGAVRRTRIAAQLSQEAYAERCELSARYVSNIERGTQEPGFSTMIKLARGLGLRPSGLLHKAGL